MLEHKIFPRLFLSFLLVFCGISSVLAAPVAVSESVAPRIQTYEELLQAIRSVRAASEQRIEQEKVRVAWETGKLIDAHVLGHKERADYGQKVLERLSNDLGTSRTELSYMLKFFRTYPILPTSEELSWSRYREILSLNETEARKEVADEAVRQNWSVKQVRAEVRRRQAGSLSEKPEALEVSGPGKLYTYAVVKPAEGPYAGELALDLGFAVMFRPEGFDLSAFKKGDTVRLENGTLIKAEDSSAFSYNAYVTEIIDGDTFHARIDLGFGITIREKLRLRGLDAPIVESADGREAKAFLEKHLPTRGAPILIRAAKSDKYDRYLADIWAGGTYVNQELINQGLAVWVHPVKDQDPASA